MRLSKIIEALNGHVLVEGEHLQTEVRHVVDSDLMSEALLAEEDDLLMCTTLTTEHAVRTAHVLGALGVLVINGQEPRDGMRRAAEELGVTLACCPCSRKQVMEWFDGNLGYE